MRISTFVLALGVFAGGLGAQERAPAGKRLSIGASGGGPFGGPAASILEQLEASGFGEVRPYSCIFVFCSGPTDYPEHVPGATAELTLRYELPGRWGASAGFANVSRGGATGFGSGGFITSDWKWTSYWASAQYRPVGPVSAGIGPSLHRFQKFVENGFQGGRHFSRVGLTGEASLRLPRASRVFWEVTFRAHWVPGRSVVTTYPSGSGPVGLRVGWSYTTLTTGVGLRL